MAPHALQVLLVPLRGSAADARCLSLGFTWARRLEAAVVAAITENETPPLPIMAGADGLFPLDPVLPALDEIERARRQRARDAYRQALAAGTAAFGAELVDEESAAPDALHRRILLADLVIAARVDAHTAVDDAILQTTLFDCGRPLALAPAHPPPPGAPAVVGWNGSAECARALTASLPLLRLAAEAVVVQVSAQADSDVDLQPVLRYLQRHAVAARGERLSAAHPGPALLEYATRCGAGLLVMGAYGHGRARRLIFGGTTRDVIQHAELPVLLAH